MQVKACLSVEYKGTDYCIVEVIPDYLQSYIESDFAECEDVVLYPEQSRCDIGIVAILHLILFFSHLQDSKPVEMSQWADGWRSESKSSIKALFTTVAVSHWMS